MIYCPKCTTAAPKLHSMYHKNNIPYLLCQKCRGVVILGRVLKKLVNEKSFNFLIERSKVHKSSKNNCTACEKPMACCHYQKDETKIGIDYCRRCKMIYFDKHEEKLFFEQDMAYTPPESILKIDGIVGELKLNEDEELAASGYITETNITAKKIITRPWSTWLITAIIVLLNVAPFTKDFFIHDKISILTNIYYLLALGSILEKYIGHTKYLIVYFTSFFVGVSTFIYYRHGMSVSNFFDSGIFGILGAMFYLIPDSRLKFIQIYNIKSPLTRLKLNWNIPVYLYVAFYVVLQVCIPFSFQDEARPKLTSNTLSFIVGYFYANIFLVVKLNAINQKVHFK